MSARLICWPGSGPFGRASASGACNEFAFVVGSLGLSARLRAGFVLRAGVVHFLEQLFPASDFLGQSLRVGGGAIGRFGLSEQLLNVLTQFRAQLGSPLVRDVLVFGRAGFEVRAVQTHGAQLEQFELSWCDQKET